MSRTYHEDKFPEMDYEDFYQDHYFEPVSDEDALNAHRIFPRVGWALDVAKEIKPKTVLDLGCLEGYAVLTLANHCDSVKSGVGVDLSNDGIELGRKRAKAERVPVSFAKAPIETWMQNHLTLGGAKFDLIMAFEVMEHVKDPELVFDLIDKVAAPGTTVLISTPAFESPTFGKDDEKNKCHVRLYTLEERDYTDVNKYGNTRKATSLPLQLGPKRTIVSKEIYSELIHLRYLANAK